MSTPLLAPVVQRIQLQKTLAEADVMDLKRALGNTQTDAEKALLQGLVKDVEAGKVKIVGLTTDISFESLQKTNSRWQEFKDEAGRLTMAPIAFGFMLEHVGVPHGAAIASAVALSSVSLAVAPFAAAYAAVRALKD